MSIPTTLQVTRHQVAIAGNVTDAQTGMAIWRARVEIIDAPEAFIEWLKIRARQFAERWTTMDERPDRILTAVDGHFHFLDLPDGDYTLVASLPGTGSRYGTTEVQTTVSREDPDDIDRITMTTADISLPPTTLKGQITDHNDAAIHMAVASVQGSGERAFSNSVGGYKLSGLETGQRTILVSARGYQPATETATLVEAGGIRELNFVLSK